MEELLLALRETAASPPCGAGAAETIDAGMALIERRAPLLLELDRELARGGALSVVARQALADIVVLDERWAEAFAAARSALIARGATP